MVRPARCLLRSALALGFLGSVALAPVAGAVPLPADLTATAFVGFDEGFATSLLSSTGTQSGSFSLVAGAASATTTYAGAVVSDRFRGYALRSSIRRGFHGLSRC